MGDIQTKRRGKLWYLLLPLDLIYRYEISPEYRRTYHVERIKSEHVVTNRYSVTADSVFLKSFPRLIDGCRCWSPTQALCYLLFQRCPRISRAYSGTTAPHNNSRRGHEPSLDGDLCSPSLRTMVIRTTVIRTTVIKCTMALVRNALVMLPRPTAGRHGRWGSRGASAFRTARAGEKAA